MQAAVELILRSRNCYKALRNILALPSSTWYVIGIKSPHAGFRTNDPDRDPFRDKSGDRLQYLTKVATTYKRMDNSPRGQRMNSLTSDTSNALHRILTGIVALIKLKLDIGFSYVLPGKVQSDRIEGEFGIYGQKSGEN